jgi:hypothetical protein
VEYIKITASKKDIPLLRGYKNQGLKEIEAKTGATVVKVESDEILPQGRIIIEGI